MMELEFFLRMCIVFFAVMGYLRGLYKEFVGLAGILLALFFLTEFGWLVDLLIGGTGATTRFMVEVIYVFVFTFFAYQQAPTSFAPRTYRTSGGRVRFPDEKSWQRRFLGALVGGFNGYLVVGSLWYLMDQLEYPLEPLFLQPTVGTRSADFVTNLPLVWLQQANLLVWLVAGLFMLIIIFR